MDRISRLPQPIQHEILNFLEEEEEIARAAVLSKAWRSIVHTRPVLVFDQRKHGLKYTTRLSKDLIFMNHVDKSIERLVGQELTIQKFSLEAEFFDTKSWSHNLDRWIQQLVRAKVKVLILNFELSGSPPYAYVLPPIMLLSETITNLRLGRCQLGQCDFMRLPNLLELSFRFATLSQDTIDRISSGCPNLETLRLFSCNGLSSICVSGLARLYEVELRLSFELDVKIVAPMLRVFNCERSKKIDLLPCESTLRSLTLSLTKSKDDLLSFFTNRYNIYTKSGTLSLPNTD